MNAEPRKTLSEQLVMLRKAKGIGHLDMGRMAGLTLAEIVEVESGNPTFSVMSRYAAALGYEIVVARRSE
jgi:transcriptional regulator with XRE-family HTH domain